jgi:hypothetical protein
MSSFEVKGEVSSAPAPLVDGDIYRWSYRDPDVDMRQYGTYHCCSRIAVVRRGRLRDTYWGMSAGSDGRSFGPDDVWRLDLERLGNFENLEQAPEYQKNYYDDADIVNLNHSNSSRNNFYLRKGAKRSQKKMLEAARYQLEQNEAAERSAADRAQRLRETIARIEAGDTETYI